MEKLTPRQWALKRYLESHFESGKFITIEEICREVRNYENVPYYHYNTNPYVHDKCACLSADVRAINWSVEEGWKIIIKDNKGNVKLCESEEEFNDWREKELAPLTRKWKYLNNLVYKTKRDGIMPILNQRLNPVPEDNLKPIETYMKGER